VFSGGRGSAGWRVAVGLHKTFLRHRCEPDSAEMAARYGAEMTVPDLQARLVCGRRRSRRVDIGGDRRARQPNHLSADDRSACRDAARIGPESRIRRCFARCADEPIGEESKPRRRDILSARSGAVTPSYTSRDPARSPVASKRKTRAEAQVWSSAVRRQSPKLVGTGRLFALFLLIPLVAIRRFICMTGGQRSGFSDRHSLQNALLLTLPRVSPKSGRSACGINFPVQGNLVIKPWSSANELKGSANGRCAGRPRLTGQIR
jgi:hypothetical protein